MTAGMIRIGALGAGGLVAAGLAVSLTTAEAPVMQRPAPNADVYGLMTLEATAPANADALRFDVAPEADPDQPVGTATGAIDNLDVWTGYLDVRDYAPGPYRVRAVAVVDGDELASQAVAFTVIPVPRIGSILESLENDPTLPAECVAAFEASRVTPLTPLTSVPATMQWDTTKCPNGTYRITARASDAAGNVGTDSVEVTVLNIRREPLLRVIYAGGTIEPVGGYVELIAQDTKRRQFGLTVAGQRFRYSIAVQNGTASIIENSKIIRERPAQTGTTFRIDVKAGVVSYLRNGVEFYRSTAPLDSSAQVEAALEDAATVLGYLFVGR